MSELDTRTAEGGLMAALSDGVALQGEHSGPAWLVARRTEASRALRERGFPGKKHEAWRFTSVRDVVDTRFTRGLGDVDAARALVDARLGDDGTWRIVLANGRPGAIEGAPAGVSVRSLREVMMESASELEGVLGALAAPVHFAALNAALFEDGVAVIVERGALVERPIHVVHVAQTDGTAPRASYPRVVVIAREGSQATLVESFLDGSPDGAPHLTNAVTEIDVGPNARLEHVRFTEGSARETQLATLCVRQARDSFYGSRVVTLGGRLVRLDLTLRFEGPGTEAELDGVYHVTGTEHVDHQLRVVHASGRSTSHVRYRGLLDGRGHAVFNAVGVVEQDAQQSAAHQENKNLLLSGDATLDTKPHLEIDADDIAASHGVTVGALDPMQSFYLRSRGIPALEARSLLTFAFVQALLDRVPHPALAARASAGVLARLPQSDAMAELAGAST